MSLQLPKILSVSKFCADNDVFFEFHATCCLVKDRSSKTVVLKGKLHNGLYIFDKSQVNLKLRSTLPAQSINTLSTSNSSSSHVVNTYTVLLSDAKPTNMFELWHRRLGHPSSRVVSKVLSLCNIHIPNNMTGSVCPACCYGKMYKYYMSLSNMKKRFKI